MPNAYVYTRVSTIDQNLSPDWQANVCKVYYETALATKGYGFGGLFHDHGESAYSIDWRDRTAGREMFNLVKPGDIIVVAKMCRAFRSTRDRENCLHFLGQVGIDIAILDCNMDTTTAAGKFAAGIIALQVQWESDVKSERMKAAHSIRKAKKTPMKACPPPGWKYDKLAEELVPDWEERRLLAMVYDHQQRGIRNITQAAKFFRSEGIKRHAGTWYDKSWLYRAYACFVANFPCDGYWKKQKLEKKTLYGKPKPKKDGKRRSFRKTKTFSALKVSQPAASQLAGN
jgi:DNA invertase Pin-like site-specific DNA recombinase